METGICFPLKMRRLDVLVFAVVGQIKRQNVEPVIGGLVADKTSLLTNLEIHNSALQLGWLQVAECF